ncbi:MAG: transposase, partial [bacterium]
ETLDKIMKKVTDRVVSFVDVDARWGHKTPERTFLGYKVHTVQDESRIVTSVDTFSGNENEGTRLIGLLKEDKRKGIEGTGVTADKLYDSIDNRKGARKLGLIPYILSKTSRKKIDDFNYDVETGVLTCKAGKEPIGKIKQGRGWLYYFSMDDCKVCSHQDKCLRGNEKRQRVYLSEAEKDRLLAGEAVTRKEAKRIRSEVEPKYGEAKVWHGLGRARWWERWRVAIQAFITFSVTNAKRLVKLVEKRERKLCST